MKKSELKELFMKPESELNILLRETRITLRSLLFDYRAGKMKNAAEIKKTKTHIARILTALTQQNAK